ncbi:MULTISPECIES: I78 family peptidase inhibitor [Sphingobium]|uniref:Peptidase inhibitor I78 n=1 Tax=Sphingobium chungbukense TaxID=56193 RepID=A0A0M3ATN4_9SPHN|nr:MULTISPECIES: I78 family peptidase inhibitor [Sphingobium]KKW93195.1 peptidase inhibitor I78 [Sphingobium chungbukense]PJG48629.1 peptidase inhibitor I78 [Sphingobium sp. LB126]
MRTAALALLPLLAACAGAAGEGPATPPAVAEGPCRNEGLGRFIGQIASAELGTELLKASGARTLRWGAPGMAMTMDFRPDRLTVSYDGKMTITSARCG